LRRWLRLAEQDAGAPPALTTSDQQRLKDLERENKELRLADEILRKASASQAPMRRSTPAVRDVRVHRRDRAEFGVAPSCEVLAVAPSVYYAHHAGVAHPWQRSARVLRDEALANQIDTRWHEAHEVYGAKKMWKVLRR
jgi:hypothetical protein